MMDTSTCGTLVLVLLWLYLCCQALGSLVALTDDFSTNVVLYITTTMSTVLLGLCLWQCKKAGYLVSPMTWYHWVLLLLLVILQEMAVVMEKRGWGILNSLVISSTYPIYGVVFILLSTLGSTLYCGWKCNLFCRPCCKSQYVCYGSAIVVVLVVLVVLALTASLIRFVIDESGYGNEHQIDQDGGENVIKIIGYLGKILVPCTHCYTMAVMWNTTFKLPYTVLEMVSLLALALAVASILTLAIPNNVELLSKGFPLFAVHLVSLGITWYCLEYKAVFQWPKDHMCFGLLAAVLVSSLVTVVIANSSDKKDEHDVVKYTLLGYSMVLMVPTLWYAYRCGLLTWRWNSCLPKKGGLKATDTAENTIPATDIAKES
uniref:Membrane protein n=1 Tax=Babesia bovis TaxID=5865 RepID=S6B6H2_BABBO|nr:membrane protein [Babesia bovis]